MKKFDNIYMKKFLYFNVYVIKGKDGDILIDTGFIGMRKSLKKWLDKFNIKLIILTHAHVDHVWNVDYLKKLYGCDVAIGKLDVENLDNSKIENSPKSRFFNGWAKLMKWGMNKFVPKRFDVDMFLEDNQYINKYDLDLKIVNLSGHTDGSIGILYNDYLFAGDALVNRRIRRVEVAYQNQNNDEALRSSRRILDLKPKMVFVGHDRAISFNKLKRSLKNV